MKSDWLTLMAIAEICIVVHWWKSFSHFENHTDPYKSITLPLVCHRILGSILLLYCTSMNIHRLRSRSVVSLEQSLVEPSKFRNNYILSDVLETHFQMSKHSIVRVDKPLVPTLISEHFHPMNKIPAASKKRKWNENSPCELYDRCLNQQLGSKNLDGIEQAETQSIEIEDDEVEISLIEVDEEFEVVKNKCSNCEFKVEIFFLSFYSSPLSKIYFYRYRYPHWRKKKQKYKKNYTNSKNYIERHFK